ncbi:MAG: phosphoglycerate dehydrogenase [archaeon]|nr:phosphoglycerate dehydrogenase [archaeon]
MTTKILVSDKLDKAGLEILEASGLPVVMKPGMTEDELCAEIVDYDALIIRSGTRVTKKVIDAAKNLRLIGRAGVGVDNVDIPYATEKGILIMNTPSANTLSAAEHTCAMILAMARNIPQAHKSMHEGKWDRSAYTGVELNGKTLGIIGTGRVGLEVAKRLKAFNMKMVASDPFPPKKEVLDEIGITLLPNADEVVKVADFITIHSPLLPSTKGMISMPQFKMMKPTCRVANVARGGIVDEDDLYTALKEKIIAGAAFDVWCNEPLDENEKKLLELDNIVTTPHLGASTKEAQLRVAVDIAESAVKYLKEGIITNAINVPRGKLTPETAPFVPLAERLGTFANHLTLGKAVTSLEVVANGNLANGDTNLLRVHAVKGYIRDMVGADNANIINAEPVAKSKGIEIKDSKNPSSVNYSNIIEIKVVADGESCSISGTSFGDEPRLVGYNGYSFNVPLNGNLVFLNYADKTGIVGAVGTVLGQADVDIKEMAVAVKDGCSKAMMVLIIGKPLDESKVADLARAIDGTAKFVSIN